MWNRECQNLWAVRSSHAVMLGQAPCGEDSAYHKELGGEKTNTIGMLEGHRKGIQGLSGGKWQPFQILPRPDPGSRRETLSLFFFSPWYPENRI